MEDKRYVAADGALITDGARMFNYYDGEWVTVHFAESLGADPASEYHASWDGWFQTTGDSGRRAYLNGERLAGAKPAWMK